MQNVSLYPSLSIWTEHAFHGIPQEKYHESDVRKEFEVLLETIAYIHGEQVVVRNLAPGNILLVDPEDDGRIKLVDFSCACSLRNGLVKPTGGNSHFAAPEIIYGESHGTVRGKK